MNRGRSVLVLVVLAVLIGGAVWLFATAGGPSGSTRDPAGDVDVSKGANPPKEPALADLRDASVEVDDGSAVFEASVASDLPDSFDDEAIAFTWRISEDGRETWIVSASVNIEATAAVVATHFDYRRSSIDGSLPGTLEIDGRTLRLTLDTTKIKRFPASFSWTLQSELDGDRSKAPSAEARDSIPDEGSLEAGS